jgi:hypothetical protein
VALAEIRTLKLNLLADVNQFGRGLKQAEADTTLFGSTVSKISKRAQLAFAAMAASAGYAAIRIGQEAVQAALEDEKSQVTLAKALQNTTKATDAQIAATEDYISKTQLAFGVSDTKLRPALANLTRATGDLEKSQKLTNLALDISAATGKDLESVTLALGKAYNGNVGALTKLGVPLDEATKKTKDFNVVQDKLTELFGGAAAANADTYAGRLAIVSEKTGELKESIGTLLLPEIEKLVNFADRTLLPTLQQVADGFAGKPTSTENSAYLLGQSLNELKTAFSNMFGVLNGADGKNADSALRSLAGAITLFADSINFLSTAADKFVTIWNKIPPVVQQLLLGSTGFALAQLDKLGAYASTPTAALAPPTAAQAAALSQGNVTINLNGVVDGESARRSIEKVLQNSGSRTSAVKLARLPL